ncbi:hypothetical protein AD947_02875 [Acetobacter tropicalis]|uniref:UmuC domain-containing protein n=1 Tax=Acetobacter tropicalis TaxID=104102 RepID=A0A149U3V8_9PROT|nr:DNA polymerase Y family protein [Acetobacter tropicalis]KXV60101.1 hypothetical protein AD947_02875 [Acetobacter tropicalis]
MTRRILSLWLPLWRTDLWHRRHPDTCTSSGLVLHYHDGRRLTVLAADATAQARGVRPGMSLAHARALAPDLHATDGTPDADRLALTRLTEWFLWLSPIVAPDGEDGVWVDTAGCAHLHGGEAPMMAEIRRRIQSLGYTCRLALADTPGAASALARFARVPCTIISPGTQRQALAALPVQALRLAPPETDALLRLGFRTVGALYDTPRAPLARRLGGTVLARLDQVLGLLPEPVQPIRPIEAIRERRSFVEPIATAGALATVIAVLVRAICETLEGRGEGARLVDLLCERVDGTVQAIRIGTASPVADPVHLSRLLDERIPIIEPGFGIEAMTLVVTRAEVRGAAVPTGELVGQDDVPQGRSNISCLLDRLQNRLGPGRVSILEPAASHLPEFSQTRCPASGEKGTISADLACSWPRPVRLLNPPEPVDVTIAGPEEPPTSFRWRDVHSVIRAADGPERLHEEWWRSADPYGVVRDYWIVEDNAGERYWIFCRAPLAEVPPAPPDWFLHGLF